MAGREASPGSWPDRPSSVGSPSKLPLFPGPPPPIAASAMISNDPNSPRSQNRRETSSRAPFRASGAGVSSAFLSQRREFASQTSDSAWRSLRRREQALELDIQQLLDLQAAALVAVGLDARRKSALNGQSNAGRSTPTGTFYSTASSTSRMPKSLYMPPQSAREGNVIPVRQPTRSRSMGLRAARQGLQRSITALTDLRREEYAHVDAALADRRTALARLDRLGTKRTGIYNELKALEGDEEELLGKELRELGAKYDSLDREIRLLEDKLVGMRNRRLWLRDKVDHVRNKREAGLSGYRGALKDVNAQVGALMRRPPVQPLDREMLCHGRDPDVEAGSAGGSEFMRLIPERRTVEMAKAWWEAEIRILERRKACIDAEQQVLEDGGATWQQVMTLVTDFESNLRGITKTGTHSNATRLDKDKENVPSQEELIRGQLSRMNEIVAELGQHMQLAESKRWNLLICAIGAELEVFQEAHSILKSIVDGDGEDGGVEDSYATYLGASPGTEEPRGGDSASNGGPSRDEGRGESDNEVPPDLLISRLKFADGDFAASHGGDLALPQRQDIENEVPAEFLAEHHHDKDH